MEQNQNGNVVKQRIMRSEPEILAILEEYEKSGFMQKEYCQVSDINEVTFSSWLRKYRPKTTDDELKGFTAIEVVNMPVHKSQLFAEVGNIKIYRAVPAEYLKALLS
jgi:hypothetical protein